MPPNRSAEPHTHVRAHAIPVPVPGRGQRQLALVLGLTGLYTLVQVAGGVLFGSLALLADSGHMLADVLGLGMALFAMRFAERPATPTRTYGFYRAEVLAALLNSLVLLGVAGLVLLEAWRRLTEPQAVASLPMLLVALGGLAVNLVGLRVLHPVAHGSLNVRGALLEVTADLLGSIGVIVAAVGIALTGWQALDPLMSAILALFILPRTWHLLRSALDVLLEATPSHLDLAALEAVMRAVPGVESVHELHAWTITSGFVALSAHVLAEHRGSSEVLHDLLVTLRERFRIEHATIQVERTDHADDEGACCTLDPRCLVVGGR